MESGRGSDAQGLSLVIEKCIHHSDQRIFCVVYHFHTVHYYKYLNKILEESPEVENLVLRRQECRELEFESNFALVPEIVSFSVASQNFYLSVYHNGRHI